MNLYIKRCGAEKSLKYFAENASAFLMTGYNINAIIVCNNDIFKKCNLRKLIIKRMVGGIMKRAYKEALVLKKLGIPDFRHMTKDKVVKFATMLPFMDPEVAKRALEQFPAFKDMASDLVVQYKDIIEKAFDKNEVSQKAFFDTCNSIIVSLQKELEKDNLSPEDRSHIEDRMIEVAKMVGEKDSENKNFLWKMAATLGIVIVGSVTAAAAILGSNTQVSTDEADALSSDDIVDIQ